MTEAVDFEGLNRLFAQIPEGPYHALRSGGGHGFSMWEVRQIDTNPTDQHHWPFRLCESIRGQVAYCDEATFNFIAGVLNVWPQIAALASVSDLRPEGVKTNGLDPKDASAVTEGQTPSNQSLQKGMVLEQVAYLQSSPDGERKVASLKPTLALWQQHEGWTITALYAASPSSISQEGAQP